MAVDLCVCILVGWNCLLRYYWDKTSHMHEYLYFYEYIHVCNCEKRRVAEAHVLHTELSWDLHIHMSRIINLLIINRSNCFEAKLFISFTEAITNMISRLRGLNMDSRWSIVLCSWGFQVITWIESHKNTVPYRELAVSLRNPCRVCWCQDVLWLNMQAVQ